jgi:uncharacterized protein YegL
VITYWPIYPARLQKLFIDSFTIGLKDPARRVTEKQWLAALVNLIFGVLKCPSCGAEVFFDGEKAEKGAAHTCWNCKKQVPEPITLIIGGDRIPLPLGTRLPSHYIAGDYDIASFAGTVIQNPNNPQILGLRNDTQSDWTYIKTDGTQVPVPPGKSAALVKAAKVNFGQKTGEFHIGVQRDAIIAEEQAVIPYAELPKRPQHLFFVIDTSGSMADGGKMGIANNVIQECVPEMREIAKENPFAQFLVRTLRFSSGASWIEADPVRIEEFAWSDLEADGVTDSATNLGKAFEMLAAQLTTPPMPKRALPPVIALLSDGRPTDDYRKSLDELLKLPWGKKAVKIAIAIGKEAQNEEAQKVFFEFTGNKELILEAHNITLLTHMFWKSEQSGPVPRSDEGNGIYS